MALHARDGADRAEQLMVLSARLQGLVERETALFEARTPHEALAFAEEKNTLATTYRLETARIAKDPGLLADAPAQTKDRLRQVTLELDKALNANHQAAATVRVLTEGLVQAIAREAARSREGVQGYGANGRVDSSNASAAITLNRQV